MDGGSPLHPRAALAYLRAFLEGEESMTLAVSCCSTAPQAQRKTTLARAFQDRQEPWFHLALDQFRDGMPPAYRGLNSPEGCPGARA